MDWTRPLVMLGVGGALILVAVLARVVKWVVTGDSRFYKSGGPPIDLADPEKPFFEEGRWFAVELWPKLAPSSLMRPFDNGPGVIAYLLVGVPMLLVLGRIDRRTKVVVFEGNNPFLMRIRSQHLYASFDEAEEAQSKMLREWPNQGPPAGSGSHWHTET